jgi:hypothetical protein
VHARDELLPGNAPEMAQQRGRALQDLETSHGIAARVDPNDPRTRRRFDSHQESRAIDVERQRAQADLLASLKPGHDRLGKGDRRRRFGANQIDSGPREGAS